MFLSGRRRNHARLADAGFEIDAIVCAGAGAPQDLMAGF